MPTRNRYKVAVVGLVASLVPLSVVLDAIDRTRPPEPPSPPEAVRTYSTWCMSPEQRASVEVPEVVVTEGGAVVEVVPIARGGPR